MASSAVATSEDPAQPQIMLADDCCAVALILDSSESWRVPSVPPDSDLLTVGSQSVAVMDGERHIGLRNLMREGVHEANRHVAQVTERVLADISLPRSGRTDLVREFVGPVVFRVKACLLGDLSLWSEIASWSAEMFGGSWHSSPAPAVDPRAVIARFGDRPGPVTACWQRCVAEGRMTRDEQEGALLLFAVAGNDAVVVTTARCIAKLSVDGDLQRRLRERPELVADFVTSTVTSDPPVRYTFRVRPGGGLTVVSLFARKAARSCPVHGEQLALPFGRGAHTCMGAELGLGLAAKLLDALLARTEWLSPGGEPIPHPNEMFNGFVELPTVIGLDSEVSP